MSIHRTRLLAGLALVGGAMLLVVKATGQAPTPQIVQETVLEQTPEGKLVPRTVVRQRGTSSSAGAANPYRSGNRAQVPVYVDPEVAILHQDELDASDEAARLAEQIRRPGGDTEEIRKQLREKLATIFDLQQKRRGHEVAAIEARLNKLKDVMQKREDAKDSIVDRRLEVLTGGIDELGWEETEPLPARFLPIPAAGGMMPGGTIVSPGEAPPTFQPSAPGGSFPTPLNLPARAAPRADSARDPFGAPERRAPASRSPQPADNVVPRNPEPTFELPSLPPSGSFPGEPPRPEPEPAAVEPTAAEPEVSR